MGKASRQYGDLCHRAFPTNKDRLVVLERTLNSFYRFVVVDTLPAEEGWI